MNADRPMGPAALDLRRHLAEKEAERIKAELTTDRIVHWKTNAVDGLQIPMCFPPALKFVGASVEDQVAAVFSEARELADALMGEEAKNGMWLLELLDLQHSIETLERILVDQYGPEALNNARAMVVEKNAARSYYRPASEDATLGE